MRQGYAGEGPQRIFPDFPGEKFFIYEQGDWRVADRYVVGKNGWSSGWTTIHRCEVPIWSMSYYGRYDKKAASMLKASLLENYRQKIFFGGRGPRRHQFDVSPLGTCVYENVPQQRPHNGGEMTEFGWFEGQETITLFEDEMRFPRPLGFHKYVGRILR